MLDRILAPDLLALAVEGRRLRPGRLGDQWGSEPTLVVFLRHLGCIFCREAMALLRESRSRHADFPPVIFVHPSSAADGETFFAREDPEARAIADVDHAIARGFEVKRAKLGQVVGPTVLACGFRAYRAGHRQTGVQGDPWWMPGYFLVRDDRLIWAQPIEHIADRPDFDEVREIAIANRSVSTV
ncbi:MAG: SelL-related redox protein [Isosphaeraceae bacterium]|nr:SelL-related redox protein [Isosphaeraceae bacterium]